MDVLEIDTLRCDRFINMARDVAVVSPDLSKLQGENVLSLAALAAAEIFVRQISKITESLKDPSLGVAAIDIPNLHRLPEAENAFWGCVIAMSIARNIFEPQLDFVNQTPFTVYAASSKNSEKLASVGIPSMSPETKLGFHTDGTVHNGRVSVPHHIMLYNVAIEYEHPGCFHWIPFSKWKNMRKFIESFGLEIKYLINLTASVYEKENGTLENFLPSQIFAPIFFKRDDGGISMYLNGHAISKSEDGTPVYDAIDDLKKSLSAEKFRYSIPQQTRRAIFAANTLGAHARDIFQGARGNVPFNRIFLRSVDRSGVSL